MLPADLGAGADGERIIMASKHMTDMDAPADEVADEARAVVDRGRDALSRTAEDVAERAADTFDDMRRKVKRAYDEGYDRSQVALRRSAEEVTHFSERHPFVLFAAGIGAGLLLATLFPRRVEAHEEDLIGRARRYRKAAYRQAQRLRDDFASM